MKKIAILGAMHLEIEPILEKFNNYKTINYANNFYYLVNYKDKELVIACSKIGKVFSSLTATIMIEHFKVEALFFTGVAGGLQNLKVGDMIIATSTVQHDIDITAFGYKYGKIPTSKVNIKTSNKLLKHAQNISNQLNIKLHTGVIATGDQFLKCIDRKNFLIKEFNAKAVEMEGGSVNLICNEMRVPSLILRSISDNADIESTQNFNEFVKITAKKSANLIFKIISDI